MSLSYSQCSKFRVGSHAEPVPATVFPLPSLLRSDLPRSQFSKSLGSTRGKILKNAHTDLAVKATKYRVVMLVGVVVAWYKLVLKSRV